MKRLDLTCRGLPLLLLLLRMILQILYMSTGTISFDYFDVNAISCPVSSRFDTSTDLLYNYPSQYFPPHMLKTLKINDDNDYFLNCSDRGATRKSFEMKQCFNNIHHDTTGKLCPIPMANVQVALNAVSWDVPSDRVKGFLRLSETRFNSNEQRSKPKQEQVLASIGEDRVISADLKDQNHRPIYIVVIGGSMTEGRDTGCACQCVPDVDSRCPSRASGGSGSKPPSLSSSTPPPPPPATAAASKTAINQTTSNNNPRPVGGETWKNCPMTRCSWSAHLFNWFERQFSDQRFQLVNLASSGCNSACFVERFSHSLTKMGIELSAEDFVFIDNSVNDAVNQVVSLTGVDFEKLVRLIVTSVKGEEAPSVVIVEQYAWPSTRAKNDVNTSSIPYRPVDTGGFDYSKIYRAIARHYGLLLWSLRDVYWSYYNNDNNSRPGKEPESAVGSRKYTANNNNDSNNNRAVKLFAASDARYYALKPNTHEHRGIHPQWYVHLYIADILAGCVLRYTEHLTEKLMAPPPPPVDIITARRISDNRNREGSSSSSSNNNNNSASINNSNNNNNNKLPLPIYNAADSVSSMCSETIPYLLDIQSNSTYHPDDLALYETGAQTAANGVGWREYIDYHGISGWMINDVSRPENRTLRFKFLPPPPNTMSNYVLKVWYLKSYEGMGAIQISMCGTTHQKLRVDGLFTSAVDRKMHVSVPYVFAHHFHTEGRSEFCLDGQNDDYYTIDLTYETPETDRALRMHRKFKVSRIEICHVKDNYY